MMMVHFHIFIECF